VYNKKKAKVPFMTREVFDRKVHQIQDEILLLGSMVEQALLNAVEALKQRNKKAAREVYEADNLINEKRYAIENAVLIVIATQQPLAHDLRVLASNLEIITELERMGDYAKGIAKVTIQIGNADLPIPMREISKMCEIATSMLHRALSAFINEDSQTASQIPYDDDQVDHLYNDVYHQTIQAILANPSIIDQMNYIQWVAHNLERTADRATNICERTVFIATGELLEIEPTEDEDELDTE
jgi:phosphate transport system protein